MSTTTSPLRDPAFMDAFLDMVIPPSADGRMPGADGLGVAEDLAEAIEGDERMGPMVEAGLKAIQGAAIAHEAGGFAALSRGDRLEVVEKTLAAHPALMFGIARYLYPAYYQHPRVLESLGEPARPPFPEGYDIEPTDPGLLERLRERQRR